PTPTPRMCVSAPPPWCSCVCRERAAPERRRDPTGPFDRTRAPCSDGIAVASFFCPWRTSSFTAGGEPRKRFTDAFARGAVGPRRRDFRAPQSQQPQIGRWREEALLIERRLRY